MLLFTPLLLWPEIPGSRGEVVFLFARRVWRSVPFYGSSGHLVLLVSFPFPRIYVFFGKVKVTWRVPLLRLSLLGGFLKRARSLGVVVNKRNGFGHVVSSLPEEG